MKRTIKEMFLAGISTRRVKEFIDYMVVETEDKDSCIRFLNNLYERGFGVREVTVKIPGPL